MSWLLFSRAKRQVQVFAGNRVGGFASDPLGTWVAHNDVASNSKGIWPNGTYRWSHYNLHAEMGFAPGCFAGSYGCDGIHVFAVHGRPGIGIHAGRFKVAKGFDVPGGVTMGCIRVADEAMRALNEIHMHDRLVGIVVQ